MMEPSMRLRLLVVSWFVVGSIRLSAEDLFTQIVFDPTTYIPAVIVFDAENWDWQTSQPLFRLGYVEQNPRFTRSGQPNSAPLAYADGKRVIWHDTFKVVLASSANNVGSRLLAYQLTKNHPTHSKLIRVLGWVERIGFASWLSYYLSIDHYRQARLNIEVLQEIK